jgi:hypothetical protein
MTSMTRLRRNWMRGRGSVGFAFRSRGTSRSTRPGQRSITNHESRIEIAIYLQTLFEAQIAETRLAGRSKKFDERPDQGTQDLASGGSFQAVAQLVEELFSAVHQGRHVTTEQGLEESRLCSKMVMERRG